MPVTNGLVYGPKLAMPKNRSSLGEHFIKKFEAFSDRVAQVLDLDGVVAELTYAAIFRGGKIFAGVLREHGIKPKDTVMVVCGNTLDYAPIFWGTLFVGAAVAPVNPLYDKSDMVHLLHTIRPQLVISVECAEATIQEALTEYTGPPVATITMAHMRKRLQETTLLPDLVLGEVEDPDTHVASVLCTSGSSGKPKCVEISHTSLLHQFNLDYLKSPDGKATKQLVSVNIAGPFGVGGQMITLLSLNTGMKCVLVPIERFEEKAFLCLLEKYKINFVIASPCQVISLCKLSKDVSYDLSNIMSVAVGGSPVTLALYDMVKATLNVSIAIVYAMTEATGLFSPAYNRDDKRGSAGTLAVNVVAKIVDTESGKVLGPMQEGEICFKCPTIMQRYRNNPEATAAAFDKEGFFHTGDTAFYDHEGYIFMVDRIKELIKYRNVHVPASDIEDVLLLHPAVLEAAVIGVYHETDWEHATAIVVKKPELLVKEKELVKLVENKLPELKWLRGGVHFVDFIPKSLNGKIDKRLLRSQYGKKTNNLILNATPKINKKPNN